MFSLTVQSVQNKTRLHYIHYRNSRIQDITHQKVDFYKSIHLGFIFAQEYKLINFIDRPVS